MCNPPEQSFSKVGQSAPNCDVISRRAKVMALLGGTPSMQGSPLPPTRSDRKGQPRFGEEPWSVYDVTLAGAARSGVWLQSRRVLLGIDARGLAGGSKSAAILALHDDGHRSA